MDLNSVFAAIPDIETKHYRLRGMKLADSEQMYPFLADAETMKFITPHPVQSTREVWHEIKIHLEKYHQKREIPWIIEDKQNGAVIGMFRLHKLHTWHKKAELGAIIRKEDQNRGVMTEILGEILAFAFHDLGLNRIVGDIFTENTASEKLLKKYGFRKEGVMRETDYDGSRYHDTVVYSLLKSEYQG
ncbi:MAG TPA: GNAT family protein [Bacillales bacterium]|nr:GNAT family protein [Bacillales bacterium]